MAIKVVLFDCDGVLFDSRGANAAYYSSIAQALGRGPLNKEEEDYVHVHTVFESVAHVFRDQPELIEEAHQIRLKTGYTPFIKLMLPGPGIYECLDDLVKTYTLAVFTNRSDTIGRVLETHKMAHYFSQVVSCLDVEKPKPDPEGIFKILEMTGAAAEEAVYVGDALSDAEAARAAGIQFISYRNPEIGSKVLIDHFNQLRKELEEL